MKVSELLDAIRNRDLVLPEFQREYVWSREQAKQLLVSLYKEYPVGALLFWKTPEPPQLKRLEHAPDTLGTVQVILDGQQRLTTLYLLVTGEIPPYYGPEDIKKDLRELYFNIAEAQFQYYQVSRMRGNPFWVRVVDIFDDNGPSVFRIAKEHASDEQEAFALAQQYSDALQRLKAVSGMDVPVQLVPTKAKLDEAIDIFDRVNSQGTKLTDAELALTHVTAKWPTARKKLKDKMRELEDIGFSFDLKFMTRALTGVVARRALFESIHARSEAELTAGWQRLLAVLDYLVNILPSEASIHSTEDLNSTNVLIPLIVYLAEHDGTFPSSQAIRHAVHWVYAAHTWRRFTAQTDQRLEHDVGLVLRAEPPWEALREQIIDQRGRIRIQPSDFEGRGAQHPLYRMVFILAKAHGAVDWFNGAALAKPHGSKYQVHSHHIFPQSLLYKELYDQNSHLDRKKVNEIANRAFLTADTNVSVRNRRPEEYLEEVEQRYPGALVKQFVPMQRDLWRVERYEQFLKARRAMMSRKLNEFMDALIVEPETPAFRPLDELVAGGEALTLEFKSTLQWDIREGKQNKGLRRSVLKTLAAFLNTEGGTLVIGVEDDGTVIGLERDLHLVGGSRDRFEQLVASLIEEFLGGGCAPLIHIHLESLDGRKVCVVDVDKAPEPVFMKGAKGEREFYVRMATTSRALDPEQAHGYIQTNWE